MIGPTRGARQLAAALVAVLLAGAVGLVIAASGSRSEPNRTPTAIAQADSAAGHHLATVVATANDDYAAALDLAALPIEALPLTAVALAMALVGALAGRSGSPLITVAGRAPPRA